MPEMYASGRKLVDRFTIDETNEALCVAIRQRFRRKRANSRKRPMRIIFENGHQVPFIHEGGERPPFIVVGKGWCIENLDNLL